MNWLAQNYFLGMYRVAKTYPAQPVIAILISLVTMVSETHTVLNYFLNKDKKYPEKICNLSPKERDNQKANFRRLRPMKPFNST